MAGLASRVPGAVAALAVAGCTGAALPDPRLTAAEFAAAAARGDAQAVHGLLTRASRRDFGLEGTRRLLADGRSEILRQAGALASPSASVRAIAEVPYVDGERAVLEVDGGQYRISAAAGLPPAARTPAQALTALRSALARRSYAALVRLLAKETRGSIEGDLRTLVEGLDRPESLEVKVHGEAAEVEIPGGHKVLLKREAGLWHVLDFD